MRRRHFFFWGEGKGWLIFLPTTVNSEFAASDSVPAKPNRLMSINLGKKCARTGFLASSSTCVGAGGVLKALAQCVHRSVETVIEVTG